MDLLTWSKENLKSFRKTTKITHVKVMLFGIGTHVETTYDTQEDNLVLQTRNRTSECCVCMYTCV